MFDLPRLPLRRWVDDGVQHMRTEYRDFFRLISDQLEVVIKTFEQVLMGPEYVVFGVIVALAILAAGWRVGVFAFAGFALISNLGLWADAMSTIALVLSSGVVCMVLGVPLGIAMAKSAIVEKGLRPTLDLMQTMPAFVYLIPAITFFRVGPVSALFATVIFALPPVVRLVSHGIQHVEQEMTEASEAFGATPWQTLIKVQLPLARPSILVGVNQMLMMSLSMVVIAAMVGAGGLGGIVYAGISRVESGLAFEGGISIVIVAVVLDRITQGFGAARKAGEGGTFAGLGASFRLTRQRLLGSVLSGSRGTSSKGDAGRDL